VIENGPIDTGPAVTIPYYVSILNTADMHDITSAPVASLDNKTFRVTGTKIWCFFFFFFFLPGRGYPRISLDIARFEVHLSLANVIL
jgi:hypothetical protein